MIKADNDRRLDFIFGKAALFFDLRGEILIYYRISLYTFASEVSASTDSFDYVSASLKLQLWPSILLFITLRKQVFLLEKIVAKSDLIYISPTSILHLG